MKKQIQIMILALGLIAIGFFSTGCETVSSFLYTERQIETDVTLTADAVELDGVYYFADSLEAGSFTPQQVVPAGTVVTIKSTEHVPSSATQMSLGFIRALPYGELAGGLVTALLGIYGVTLNKKLKRSEKIVEGTIRGIDGFRDILDFTPQGEKIAEVLKDQLSKNQQALEVHDAVRELLKRYETPDKKPIKVA
jgi:hypothetical protein